MASCSRKECRVLNPSDDESDCNDNEVKEILSKWNRKQNVEVEEPVEKRCKIDLPEVSADVDG